MGIISLKKIIIRKKIREGFHRVFTKTKENTKFLASMYGFNSNNLISVEAVNARAAIREYYAFLKGEPSQALSLLFNDDAFMTGDPILVIPQLDDIDRVDFDEIVEEEYKRAQNRYTKMYGCVW